MPVCLDCPAEVKQAPRCTSCYDKHRLATHGDQRRARRRELYRQNPGKSIANATAWYERNKHDRYVDTTCRRKYGISRDERDALLQSQGGACRICARALAVFGRHKGQAVVDHCHTSGAVRGILCRECNLELGRYEKFKAKAERYLNETVA